jgi:hypothetical protein
LPSSLRLTACALIATLAVAACGTGAPTPRPTQTPQPTSPPITPPPTAPPIATPAPSPSGSVIVTFDVVGESYRILLTDPDDVAIAQRLLDGEEAPRIPNGLIVRGETSVNTGYSWSIDPESVEFADMTTEVCDGLPSYVEDGSLTGAYFCPWSAEVVAIDPAE